MDSNDVTSVSSQRRHGPRQHPASRRPLYCAAAMLCILVFGRVCVAAADSADAKPNIVFILADDLAWADLGCYGHPWHDTPHLNRLADQGMRFTQAYAAAPICSASRASLLTGKTTARLGFEFVTKNEPGYQKPDAETLLQAPPLTLNLPLEETTIPETLQKAGYSTAFFGKWHLNAHYRRYLGWSPVYGPMQQGFEFAIEDFGAHPYSWGKQIPESITKRGQFPADSMIDRTTAFLRRRHKQPFFAMVSQFYVHTPVKTRCQWLIEKYERLIPPDSPARNRRLQYAAVVETLDHYVGRILTAIDESGTTDNTIVVFTSDNGGHPEFTANGPLRGSKWNLYEGGIRVPMLVRWPGKIASAVICEEPVIGYDLHATFAGAAGVSPPATDGVSLLPLWTGQKAPAQRPLIWHFPNYHPERGYAKAPDGIGVNDFVTSRTRPHSAMRVGSHKLLHFYENDSVEMYNLDNDPAEQKNLTVQQSEPAEQMKEELRQQLSAMNARFPVPRD